MAFDYNKYLKNNPLLKENQEIPSGNLNRIDKSKSLKVDDVTTFSSGKYKGKKAKIVKDLGNGRFELELMNEDSTMVQGTKGKDAAQDALNLAAQKAINDKLGIKKEVKKSSSNSSTGLSQYLPKSVTEIGEEDDAEDVVDTWGKDDFANDFSDEEPKAAAIKAIEIPGIEDMEDDSEEDIVPPVTPTPQENGYKLMRGATGYAFLVGNRAFNISDEDAQAFKNGDISAKEAIANAKM